MIHGHIIREDELGKLAREARLSAGVSQTAAARRLGVTQGTLSLAETQPKRNLTQLRRQIIAEYAGGYETSGPYWIVKRKGDVVKDRDIYL